LQAAQSALAYLSSVQFSGAGSDMTVPDAVLGSVLNDLTDAGATSEEAVDQLFSGMTSVANLSVEIGANRSGLTPKAILEEVGALLAQQG